MADLWYSSQPQSRFSQEHRDQLPQDAKMLDLDSVLWVLYDPDNEPLMILERKPEGAREDFWHVCRRLAELAGLPAAKVVECADGTYSVFVATPKTSYEPHLVGVGMSILDWYEQVETPLRNRLRVAA